MSKAVFFHGAAPTVAGPVVSASSAARTIDAATVANSTAGALTLTLWQVPAAGTAGADNLMLAALAITAGATVTLPVLVNHALAANATINAQASGAGLTLMVSGRSQ